MEVDEWGYHEDNDGRYHEDDDKGRL